MLVTVLYLEDKNLIVHFAFQGGEFVGSKTQSFLKSEGIHSFQSANALHSYFAERYIQTIAHHMRQAMAYKNTYRWLDILPKIVKSYNATTHSQLVKYKYAPNDVTIFNSHEIYDYLYNDPKGARPHVKRVKPKFKVGDTVVISRSKQMFRKGYEARWKSEIFKIVAVYTKDPRPMYRIESLDGERIIGNFLNEELATVKLSAAATRARQKKRQRV